jgi:hypothetical protein
MKDLMVDNIGFIFTGIGVVTSAYFGNFPATMYALLAMFLQYKIIKSKQD